MTMTKLPTNNFPASLPMGFAQQVLELEMKLEQEQSLQVIQILSKMYKIAVQYYIQNDVKKASYFQRKMNLLTFRSLTADSIQRKPKAEIKSKKLIQDQVDKFVEYQKAYLKTIVENTQKAQKKIKEFVAADLNRQQERFQGRMLKRVKSTGKLL